MAVTIAVFSVIAAYLAFAQAQLLDRYIKRLEVEPDFSKFEQSNTIILVLSGIVIVGIYLITVAMYRWLHSKELVSFRSVIALVPWINLLAIQRLGRRIWERMEYEAVEKDEFHRPRKWVQRQLWFWGFFLAFPLIIIGGIWFTGQLVEPSVSAKATSTVYALVILTVAHATSALTGIYTIAMVSSLESRLSAK